MSTHEVLDLVFKAAQVGVTGVLGFVAWRIATRQATTASDKLKLDLYDRRFQLYTRLNQIVERVRFDGMPHGELLDAEAEFASARFLYGPEVVAWVGGTFK